MDSIFFSLCIMPLVPFQNTRLKKLVNVYQPSYTNAKASGLGDYLRGSLCLFQLCKIMGIECGMHIRNHPISKFLVSENQPREPVVDYNNIKMYDDNNFVPINMYQYKKNPHFYKNFIHFANSIQARNHPLYITSYPASKIREPGKTFVRNNIQPNATMKQYVIETLVSLRLQPKTFHTIHIRTGDPFMVNGMRIDTSYIKNIEAYLQKIVRPNQRYLIVSDNNELKAYLKKYKAFFIYIKPITHLGIQSDKGDETIKNTLLDFFIMRHSKSIYCITSYSHGSGFSEWCSVLYNIPYTKIMLKMPSQQIQNLQMFRL